MKFTSMIAGAVGVAAMAGQPVDLDSPSMPLAEKWTAWKSQFGTKAGSLLTGDDDAASFAKFAATDARIQVHNAGMDTYTMGHNQFSALTPQEFKDTIVGNADMKRTGPFNYADLSGAKIQNGTALDWVTKGAVTAVKDQAQCGSCWAFSTVGSMEGAYQIKTGKLTQFSEQELVSCDNKYHGGGTDQGCNGGLMDSAFTWLKSYHGMCLEADYPYDSGSGTTTKCKGGATGPSCKAAANITGHADVKSEADLIAAVNIGPVSIAIEADKSIFQSYKAGVIGAAGKNACGKTLDHGVLLVGYGTASQLKKYPGDHLYWKIKNSWGTVYGEKGYVRIARNIDECGVADGPPSYPLGIHAV